MNYTAQNVSNNIFADFSPMFRVYIDGRVDRLIPVAPVNPTVDRKTGVQSKDTVICPETGVSVRIFNPNTSSQNLVNRKIPILMYCHGGGFCSGSTFSSMYHNYLNLFAHQARIMIVSVEYRKATEHPLPAAYNDCWDALMWIFSHDPNSRTMIPSVSKNSMSAKEPWLDSSKIDFTRVYVAGDSSGANVAHQVAIRAGVEGLGKLLNGLILIHPFFWGKDRIGDETEKCAKRGHGAIVAEKIWAAACWGAPSSVDDPWLNPTKDPKFGWLGCQRVMVCVAEGDSLRDRGLLYKHALKKSGWSGDVEVVDTQGEEHGFQLLKRNSPSSLHLMRQIVTFINNTLSRL